MKDVAAAAHVSPMTVSHVLNGHPHVRPETRERVLEAITRLDYRVNHAARNLRQGRTGTIGLAVPEIERAYSAQLAAAIMTAAEPHNLRVVVEQTGASRQGELEALTLSRNRLYDGLILSTVRLTPNDADLLRVDYPIVTLGERIFDGPVDHIAMDSVAAARTATAHLLDQGARRIAFIGAIRDGDTEMATLRTRGYLQQLSLAGITPTDTDLITLPEFTMDAGRDAATHLARTGIQIDGAVCVTDTVAIGFLRGLADHDISVPGHVRVVGFDNIAEAAFTIPALTSIDPHLDVIAEHALTLLTARINRTTTGPAQEVATGYDLRIRASTNPERFLP